MRTIAQIQDQLAHATAERSRLWRELGRARNNTAAAEVARLTREIDELWLELRRAQAQARNGPPEEIVLRAQQDARLERALAKAHRPFAAAEAA